MAGLTVCTLPNLQLSTITLSFPLVTCQIFVYKVLLLIFFGDFYVSEDELF
jgi:hypothetical protein